MRPINRTLRLFSFGNSSLNSSISPLPPSRAQSTALSAQQILSLGTYWHSIAFDICVSSRKATSTSFAPGHAIVIICSPNPDAERVSKSTLRANSDASARQNISCSSASHPTPCSRPSPSTTTSRASGAACERLYSLLPITYS